MSTPAPGYNMDNARAFHRAMRQAGIDFAVYVPDSLLSPIDELLEADVEVQTVVCSREDEGIAIAMGAYLGGKLPVALMESSGLGMSGLILARGLLQRTPLLIVASHNRVLGEQFDYHGATRMVGEATLAGLNIPYMVIHDAAAIETSVREAVLTITGQRLPVGLFVPRHIARV
ncbi:MAG TPA: thiamine pyrophosphate-binding protein [Chloroflexota bacterium]|nr:thiamine pyrophosphate-binding protein [Chloroflexota bacterium]